ncbi:hypothetical protein COB55_03185 [Candidatus Wolfebacteria bacterium]|nr:MAG: hypothetical protein COB55_03185 [Candidatus Wolfebacteria bacterium]
MIEYRWNGIDEEGNYRSGGCEAMSKSDAEKKAIGFGINSPFIAEVIKEKFVQPESKMPELDTSDEPYMYTIKGMFYDRKMQLYSECATAILSNEDFDESKMFATLNKLCSDFNARFGKEK